jgi:hypothetical protein
MHGIALNFQNEAKLLDDLSLLEKQGERERMAETCQRLGKLYQKDGFGA